ncbi:hypothetical protein B0H14DRAFT_2773223 [Mycena olivaceomarginata]|nr:hypothetical protein B0H14DRAFT_2773223 [Mycena olivaceomarginata]
MRVASISTSILLAVSSVSAGSVIPKELADLATRGEPDRVAILGALQTFITDFSYPRLADIAKNITYSGFADTINGRLDITQEYNGNELNVEYIFGFAAACAALNTTLLLGYPVNQTVFALAIDPPVVSISAIANYDWKGDIGVQPLQVDTWFRYDDDLKLVGYDISMRRFSWLFETITPLIGAGIAKELNITGPDALDYERLMQTRAALDICAAHDQYCTGENQQYATHAECIDTLQNKKPLGKPWAMGIDNTMCRWVHFGMLQYRPAVHCPHVGPTGGDMCNERSYYAATLNNPFALPFVAGA